MFDNFLKRLKEIYEKSSTIWAFMWKKGRVYYDPKRNRFLQLRRQTNNYLIFGSYTEYFSSARTVILIQQLSYEYAKNLSLIKSLDKTPNVHYDGIGWCVEKKNKGNI